jgi:hypothetical protein
MHEGDYGAEGEAEEEGCGEELDECLSDRVSMESC